MAFIIKRVILQGWYTRRSSPMLEMPMTPPKVQKNNNSVRSILLPVNWRQSWLQCNKLANKYHLSFIGIFTAPVRGVYFFTFTTFGFTKTLVAASLTKNGVRIVSSFETRSDDVNDTGANSAILNLDAGDQVSIILWQTAEVYDNSNGHNSFSGFLLFPL